MSTTFAGGGFNRLGDSARYMWLSKLPQKWWPAPVVGDFVVLTGREIASGPHSQTLSQWVPLHEGYLQWQYGYSILQASSWLLQWGQVQVASWWGLCHLVHEQTGIECVIFSHLLGSCIRQQGHVCGQSTHQGFPIVDVDVLQLVDPPLLWDIMFHIWG